MSKRTAKPALPGRPIGLPDLPELPPKTEEELARARDITARLQRVVAELRQRNLDNAVLLAQQAAAGRGPLVEHFMELGRRYGELLDAPPRPCLRVVEGGGAALSKASSRRRPRQRPLIFEVPNIGDGPDEPDGAAA
jgi:hypothetical protein